MWLCKTNLRNKKVSFFFFPPLFQQKGDGSCNTSFKKTKHREQVVKAFENFVDSDVQILV